MLGQVQVGLEFLCGLAGYQGGAGLPQQGQGRVGFNFIQLSYLTCTF